MSFHDRIKSGDEYANELFERLKQSGKIIALNGAEHTHPEFHKILCGYKEPDNTSRWVRYQPDGVLTEPKTKKTWYIEAKRSETIEKDAYITYKKLYDAGCNVLLCIKRKSNDEYIVPIQFVLLIDGNITSSKYPPEIRMPVDDDGWLAPRLWSNAKYYKWKEKFTMASGTPFRYFDFKNMVEYLRRPYE